jgi:methyl-accepting chemotaxis protein
MVGWSAMETRSLAMSQARHLAASVHQMTMANLLFMKVTKTIKKREIFYEQVRQSEAIRDLRVLRGEVAIHEMGDGDEIAMNPDELEKKVLKTGKIAQEEVNDPKLGHVLRAVFPAVASENYLGKNCMNSSCHTEAKPGDVLGAVSMKVLLTDVDKTIDNTVGELIAAALMITLPLLLFIFMFIRRTVTLPLNSMTAHLDAIAEGEGDLTQRLPIKTEDEIGAASHAFNSMMEKLRSIIVSVNQTATRVTSSAENLNATSARIAKGSMAQTQNSISAAAAIEQMAVSIAGVADACNGVQELSMESRTRTDNGVANINDLQGRIGKVESAVDDIATAVGSFLTRTRSISEMTQQVRDIADQTNLLALNAAIEAARAGEHGRGFAVVADEVRKLAEKSGRSAQEIDGITHQIQAESGEVNSAIDRGLKELESAHESMVQVASILTSASTTVGKVADGMTEIRGATGEQRTTTESVSQSVESIAGLARDNSELIDVMAASTAELADLAASLKTEMARFTV